eukprot:6006702-Pleurochrysis_carterae.AAC.3
MRARCSASCCASCRCACLRWSCCLCRSWLSCLRTRSSAAPSRRRHSARSDALSVLCCSDDKCESTCWLSWPARPPPLWRSSSSSASSARSTPPPGVASTAGDIDERRPLRSTSWSLCARLLLLSSPEDDAAYAKQSAPRQISARVRAHQFKRSGYSGEAAPAAKRRLCSWLGHGATRASLLFDRSVCSASAAPRAPLRRQAP